MISELTKIEFHDLPVKSLSIDFVKESIMLVVKDYDQKEERYIEMFLLFTEVSSFYFQKNDSINISEIYDCILKENEGLYYIEFTMLTDFPAISCAVSFNFKGVKIDFNDYPDW